MILNPRANRKAVRDVVSAALLIVIGAGAFRIASAANEPAVATASPATEPAAIVLDLSTPMATVRSEKQALAAGDARALQHCYYTNSKAEQKAIDTIMAHWALVAQFDHACAAKFGEDAAKPITSGFNLSVRADAEVWTEGNNAVIYNIGGPTPTRLWRIDGEWRFTYDSLVNNNFRDLPPMPPERLARIFELSSRLDQSLLADLNAGKFATASDARQALIEGRKAQMAEVRRLIRGDP